MLAGFFVLDVRRVQATAHLAWNLSGQFAARVAAWMKMRRDHVVSTA
jgi:hypothetical protein